jgi:hypothetical protein
MASLADVTGRPDGPVFIGNMVAALQAGAPVTAPNDLVLSEPGWTLFSFDLSAGEAIFLDIGAETDVAPAPFSSQRQFETARRLLRMTLADFLDLKVVSVARQPPAHLFNMGHCGSTLVHHVLNRSGEAWCISEPAFTFDLAMNRADLSPERLTALIRVGMQLLTRFPGVADRPVVVKHFSQSCPIMPEYHAAFPDAPCLFQYREGQAWCNSLYGFHQRLGGKLDLTSKDRLFSWYMMSANTPVARLEGLADMGQPSVTFDTLAAVAWALLVERHRQAVQAGVRLHGFRYEDLMADRLGVLATVFDHIGISQDGIAKGLAAFDEDSHRGAATEHSQPVERLDDAARARIARIFANPLLDLTGTERLG